MSQTASDINNVYGTDTNYEQTVRYWFNRFHSGNLDLANELCGRVENKVDGYKLKAIVKADPSQITAELESAFGSLLVS